jgi:squalene-hopene/tetraprenyl-beta-curcumene cyclase
MQNQPIEQIGTGGPVPLRGLELSRSALEEAIARSRQHLIGLRRADGHWCGVLEGDSILESEYFLMLWYLGFGAQPRCRQLATRLRQLQQPDGGWGIYPGAPPDPSASVKAYFALKLIGDPPSAPHMVRARNRILRLGGLEAVNSFTRFSLAVHGQVSWDACPAVPPELLMLPEMSPVNLYQMSSWSRAIVVPLTILWALRPARPAEVTLGELATGVPPPTNGLVGATLVHRGWRAFFLALDAALRKADRAGLFGLTRPKALTLAQGWMLEHLDRSAGMAAIFPSMVYSVLALSALGHKVDGPLLRRELEELSKLELEEGESLRVQPCLSPVWDTALAANALLASSAPEDDPALMQTAEWILDKEVRQPGDWAVRTRAQPGGWHFQYSNEFYPDVDDTAQVLITFSRMRFKGPLRERGEAARGRAMGWLLAMQGSTGGWAAFDRDCERELLTCVPFADHNAMLDPSCPDITGRVLEALAREGLPPGHPAVVRAVRYLARAQEADGSWYGRWGCNYLYGTSLALTGLEASSCDMRSPSILRAAAFIRSRQNTDGGWGESCRSYEDRTERGVVPSTAAQTAWALIGLFAGGELHSPAARRGVDFLLNTQGADGTWHDESWTGTGFPRVFYLRYDHYDDYFPLLALAQYRARERGDWRVRACASLST